MPICRHCVPFTLADTYASRLLTHGTPLGEFVDNLEHRIIPCATALCPECGNVTIISKGTTPSVINTIVMWHHLRRWIDESSEFCDKPGETPSAE
jgi:hypothetical protein